MEPQTVKPICDAYSMVSQRADRQPNLLRVCSFLKPIKRVSDFGGSMNLRKSILTILLGLLVILLQSSQAPGQAPFYEKKTIQVVIGSAPGGLYDRWGRLFAQHLGKYIPGNPSLVAQNMPGGGSMIATNYLYGLAKPDGLTIGMFQTFMYLQQLVGVPEVKYDVRKFNWHGSQEKGQMMLYIRADSPYKSMDDILKAKEPPKCGGSGASDQTALLTRLLEETIGGKFVRVLGYPGGSEVDLAMERGEVVCRATRITVHFSREPFLTWDKKGFDRHLVQAGKKRDPRLTDVPTIYELMDRYKTPEAGRRLAQVILSGDELGRPMIAPPGVPADRIKILREAYNRALKDPELIAEVTKSRLDMDPSTGEEIEALIKEIMDQPPEVISLVKKILDG
jgi:tripartite-type tricarboxylate transporter receptor subunit TctC